jgi:hypothetical protein
MNAGVGCVPRGTLEEKFAKKEVQILLRVIIAILKKYPTSYQAAILRLGIRGLLERHTMRECKLVLSQRHNAQAPLLLLMTKESYGDLPP